MGLSPLYDADGNPIYSGTGASSTVTDDFNRADGGLGADYTGQQNAPTISGNKVIPGGTDYGSAFYSAYSFNAVQSSKITKVGADPYVAVMVHCSGVGAASNWYAFFSHGEIQKMVAGTVSSLASGGGFVAGDTAELLISALGVLTCKVNGVLVGLTATDLSLLTGYPGFGFYSFAAPSLDSFEATGAITGGGAGEQLYVETSTISPERTVRVPRENRVVRVPFERRVARVAREIRLARVPRE